MKRISLLSAWAVFTLLCIVSCQQRLSPGNYSLKNSKQVASNLGGEFFTGTMNFAVGKKGNIYLVVDTDKEGNNGQLGKRAIILQRGSKEVAFDLTNSKETFEFIAGPEAILINSVETGQRFLLQVQTGGGQVFAQKLPQSYGSYKTISGYGLSYQFGDIPASALSYVGSVSPRKSARLAWEEEDGGGAATCTAGGVGSASCSLGSGTNSCSVSCQSGYYACCTGSGCTCKANPPS